LKLKTSFEIQKMQKEADLRRRQHGFRLLGKTVVVTRTPAQSYEITRQLEAFGATVIHCATIAVAPPASWASLDDSIQRLAEYDWLVFTSTNGVEFFFHRLREKRSVSNAKLTGQVICAIGPATAQALEVAGTVANVVASESRAEGTLAAIIDYLGGPERLRGLKFLIPRASIARDILPDGLRKLGARVDAVETYQTTSPSADRDSVLNYVYQFVDDLESRRYRRAGRPVGSFGKHDRILHWTGHRRNRRESSHCEDSSS
jgi:uroporphyrinogen III methyltransferase / synthase